MSRFRDIHVFFDGEWTGVEGKTENRLPRETGGGKATNRVGEQLGDKTCDVDRREPEEEKLVKTW